MALDRIDHPPPLNIQPTGLLSFLQIKNGGRYPQWLGEQLVPTWDLAKHYEATNAQYITSAVANQAAGAQNYLIDPASNYWRHVLWTSVLWTGLNAADLIQADFCIGDPTAGTYHVCEPVKPMAVDNAGYHRVYGLVGAAVMQIRSAAKDIWIPPGWTLNLLQYSGVITGVPTLQFGRAIVDYRA